VRLLRHYRGPFLSGGGGGGGGGGGHEHTAAAMEKGDSVLASELLAG
jgi:hypothetical protein